MNTEARIARIGEVLLCFWPRELNTNLMDYTTRQAKNDELSSAAALNDQSENFQVGLMRHWKRLMEMDYLSISIGFIYLWFGALKFFPNVSPAEELATQTVVALTAGLFTAKVAIISLAVMEVLIGIGLIFFHGRKVWIGMALFHMFCTFTPLFLFPKLSFGSEPFQLTLVGQYIIKNVVIVGVLFHLYFGRRK